MLKPRHYCSWTKYSANISSAYFLHKTSIKVVVLLWWPKHVPKRVINMQSCCYYTFYDVLIAVFYNVALIPWWQFKEDDVNMWLIPYSHYVVSIFDLNNSILLGNNILKITIFLKTPFPKLLLPKAVFLDSSAQQGRDNHPTFSLIVIIRYRNSSCTWDYTSSSLLSLTFSNPCPITRSIPSHSSSSTKLHRLPLKSLVSQNGHRSQELGAAWHMIFSSKGVTCPPFAWLLLPCNLCNSSRGEEMTILFSITWKTKGRGIQN